MSSLKWLCFISLTTVSGQKVFYWLHDHSRQTVQVKTVFCLPEVSQCPSSVLMLTQDVKFSSNRVKSGCWHVPEALIFFSIRPILEKQLTFSLWMAEHESKRLPGAWKKHCFQTGRAHCLLRGLREASWVVAWCANTVGKDQQREIKSKEKCILREFTLGR